MSGPDYAKALKRKLTSQGAKYTGETSATLIFTVGGSSFSLPKPLVPGEGWTISQQELIANTLEYLGLEFWPLDFH